MLYRLLISDIGQNVPVYRHPAAVVGGYVQPTLSHYVQQPDGLEGNGLAAGIGACDYKRIEILAQLKAYGDGLILWQQRMARTAQHRSPLSQLRLYPVELIRKLRLGKNNVELDEKIVVGSNVVGVLGAVG